MHLMGLKACGRTKHWRTVNFPSWDIPTKDQDIPRGYHFCKNNVDQRFSIYLRSIIRCSSRFSISKQYLMGRPCLSVASFITLLQKWPFYRCCVCYSLGCRADVIARDTAWITSLEFQCIQKNTHLISCKLLGLTDGVSLSGRTMKIAGLL